MANIVNEKDPCVKYTINKREQHSSYSTRQKVISRLTQEYNVIVNKKTKDVNPKVVPKICGIVFLIPKIKTRVRCDYIVWSRCISCNKPK